MRSSPRSITDASIPLLPLAAVMAACVGENPRSTVTIRDSAGVTIVESHEPRWRDRTGWTIGPEPLLVLGSTMGDPAQEFFQIDGVVRLEDGSIAVADGGAGEIRAFSPSGEHRWTFGRPGEGPGEFRIIESMGVDGDGNLWVYDFSLQRITSLDPSGAMREVRSLEHEIPTLAMVGRSRDGSFILAQLWGARPEAETLTEGPRRDPVVVARFGAGGELIDTVGTFPGRELQITSENGRAVMGSPLFGRNASHALWHDSLVTGDQVLFQLGLYSKSGELARIFRIPDADLSITPRELESALAQRLADLPESRRSGHRAYLEEAGMPDRKPAYGRLLPDEAGNLWVSEYAGYPTPPGEWTVFDADGRWLGSVSMPSRFQPHQIGSDWIVGVEQDEMDVQRVTLYPLIK